MVQVDAARERRRMREVAREYEKKGYTVIREPEGEGLPPFLRGFHLDLIAYGETENVVVKIASTASLRGSKELVPLAEAIQRREGWRFELVVTNPRDSFLPEIGAVRAEKFSPSELRERLPVATYLLDVDEAAALLFAWSVVEAILRLMAEDAGEHVEGKQPLYVLQQLTMLGLLDRGDYESFREALQVRNAIIHGLRPLEPLADVTMQLTQRAKELLRSDVAA